MESLTYYQENTLRIVSKHDKQNPITGVEIAKRIDLRDRDSGKEGADMRAVINALRCKGYPICATGSGYYYARTERELSDFVASFQGRIDKQQEACSGMKLGFEKLGMQFKDPDEVEIPHREGQADPIGKILQKQTTWTYPSETEPFMKYTVIDWGYKKTCNCPAFNYRHTCKHIVRSDQEQAETQKPKEEVKPAMQSLF